MAYWTIVSKIYDEVKREFANGIKAVGYDFDEDVFSDTIEKCCHVDKLSKADEKVVRSYLWCAFKNNTLRNRQYKDNMNASIEEDTDIEEECSTVDDMFSEVEELIVKKFGKELFDMFLMHCKGVKYNDFGSSTEASKLKYKFRKIREYVRECWWN